MTFPVAYRIPAELQVRHWGCGTRRPQLKAHHQARRTRNEWVCFFSIQGSVSVIDEYDDQEYQHEIPTGIIHIIPPGMWQRSDPDFPVGSEFLWWHFCTDEQWDYCSQAQALDLIDEQLQHGQQDQWLIPSHVQVGPNKSTSLNYYINNYAMSVINGDRTPPLRILFAAMYYCACIRPVWRN